MADNKSRSSVISEKTKHSSASENLSVIMIDKRAKAEAAKAKLQFSVQEAKLRKQQALLTAENARVQAEINASLDLLEAQKQVAETEAEMKIYENNSLIDKEIETDANIHLPVEHSATRTERYVEEHSPKPLLLQSMVTVDACLGSPENVYSINNTQDQPSVPINTNLTSPQSMQHQANLPYSSSPVRETIQLNPQVPPFVPFSQPQVNYPSAMTTEFTRFLLKKDLLLTRLTTFNDRPETFALWKASFVEIMNDLGVTPSEELDLLIKWLGPESKRQAISLRSANVSNPINGLMRIWERLEQRYGCPEMVESALKVKLSSFPKLTNKDNKRLYELCGIVCEIDSFKSDPKYNTLLGYYDSSSGVLPIVNKLPHSLQEKWTNYALNYKKHHHVSFPPFAVFCAFMNEISQIRNDPSFMYDQHAPSYNSKEKPISSQNYNKTNYYSKKTDLGQNEQKLTKKSKCPLHGSNHSLNECRGFRSMSIDQRKEFLKTNNICFKCCNSTAHGSRQCLETVSCSECNSDKHPTALHFYKSSNPPRLPEQSQSQTQNGGEKTMKDAPNIVNLKCTQICGNGFAGKSCSKTVLTNVYPAGHPDKCVRAYVILDDQSNVTLAKSAFFELFHENSENIEFSLSSCAGYTQTIGRRATNYVIESIDGSTQINVASIIECDQIPNNREEIPTPEVASSYDHLRDLTNHLPEVDNNADILILVGRDIPEAHHVLQQTIGPLNSPFAQRLKLGWVIVGETCLGKVHRPDHASVHKTYILQDGRPSLLQPCKNNFSVNFTHSKQIFPQALCIDNMGLNFFEITKNDNKKGMSMEDRDSLHVMDKDVCKSPEGNWMAPLHFKSPRQRLPNNKLQAMKRAKILHKSIMSNPRKKQHFVEFMQNIFDNNHAELAPPLSDNEECWYLPLFGVYHPHKPNQIRGVFDSSAKLNGISLNDVLLKGPDLTNNLLGVLMRFRREPIAITADIQSMFHCFIVREDQRNFLRFFWYSNNDPENDLVEYRMRVHVFGNRPSPAVATYGLRKAANFSQEKYGKNVVEFVERNFYVDDALASLPTAEEAIDLLQRTQLSLKSGGNLRLHKISSNCPEVIKSFPIEDHSKDLKNLNFDIDDLPIQHGLGMSWDLQEDAFTFQVPLEENPFTRRGLLSVNSLFDPIGFAAPVVIQGKLLLRELMVETAGWDEPLSVRRQTEWEEWKSSLKALENFKIPRTYSPTSLQQVQKVETLIFSDASENIIGAVAFMVTEDKLGKVNTRFILGKAKVAPSHGHTIPRLELCAAVLAIEIAETISDQLDIPLETMRFFTDSKVVLGYLYNQSRRFYVYVANRIERIRKSSIPLQWQYIPSSHNPAGIATRPIHASDLQTSNWLHGPTKLQEPNFDESYCLTDPDTDSEIRPAVTSMTTTVCKVNHLTTHRFARFSSWKRLVQAMSLFNTS